MNFRLPFQRWTINGQIMAIILFGLALIVIGGTSLERWVRQDYKVPNFEELAYRVTAMGSILATATPYERRTLVTAANRAGWNLSLEPVDYAQRFTTSLPTEPFVHFLLDSLFPPDNTTEPYGGWRTFVDGKRVLAAKLDDHELLVLSQMPDTFLRTEALSFGSNYLVALVTMMILFSIFGVWAITRPLRRIARAAKHADISVGPALFEERGSAEIVALARALNAMQQRISMMVDARTRMLRGISHDLRTPLTRLRLRAERVGEEGIREGLRADIDRIDRLLKESLAYLRDNYRTEEFERADLASAVQTICDEFSDMGHDVTYHGPVRVIARFRPLAIARAITNLCDNATKFGQHVEVKLTTSGNSAVIEVRDDGPGIPAEQRDRVLEPFYKGDAARGGRDAGFGLGLSIIAEIVGAHRGTLELLDGDPRGLVARMTLPMKRKG